MMATTRRRNRVGVSLLEMIVVLTILATIAGAVAPAIQRSFSDGELQSTRRQFASQFDRAQRTAVSRGVPVSLSIDVKGNRYWVVATERTGDTVITHGVLELEAGERLESIAPRATIRFGPTGDVTFADAVVLRGPSSSLSVASISWRGTR